MKKIKKEIIKDNNPKKIKSEIKIESGDVLLHQSKSWLGRQIRKWMEFARVKAGLNPRTLYNHASMVIELWGKLWIIEAVGKGVHILPLEQRLGHDKQILVKTWKKILTKKEANNLSKKAVAFAGENHEYQFSAFILHIIKITFGKWFGRKNIKTQKRVNCSELVAILMDFIRNCFKGNTYDKSPLDIDLNKCLVNKTILK